MIAIVAKLRVNEGQEDAFVAAAKKMQAAVQEHEAGKTLSYDLARSTTEPTLFVFLERYVDEDALNAHRTTPHMAEFGGSLRGLLAGRAEIERFEIV